MSKNDLIQIFNNIGVKIKNLDESLPLSTYLSDSLNYISFFVEIEAFLGIELPNSFFTNELYNCSIKELVQIINQIVNNNRNIKK